VNECASHRRSQTRKANIQFSLQTLSDGPTEQTPCDFNVAMSVALPEVFHCVDIPENNVQQQ